MPTLSVTVVDKIKDKVINEEYPNILLDDSIKVIKQKIFAYHPEFIPNNLKLEYKILLIHILPREDIAVGQEQRPKRFPPIFCLCN